MLVLSRKAGERIQIGEDIIVTIVRIGPNQVRVGIDAPRRLNIARQEVLAEPNDLSPSTDQTGSAA